MRFMAAGFFFLWLDLLLGHVSAGLKHPGMWVPVLFLPWAAFVSVTAASRGHASLFRAMSYSAIVVGALGFAFHLSRFLGALRGIIELQVIFRLMRYPPLFAPLAVSGVGVLGLLVSRDERGRNTEG